MSNSLYDLDFYAWADQQAALLRAGRLTEADIEHIAEEIESMGRREKRELVDHLAVLLLHLLRVALPTWAAQRTAGGSPLRSNVIGLEDHLRDDPSLKPDLDKRCRMPTG